MAVEPGSGALIGIDLCPVAARRPGRTPPSAHRRRCPICRRRQRIEEAARGGWPPMDEGAARSQMRAMAEQFVRQPEAAADSTEAQGFYAALAAMPALEADFACEVAAAELSDVPPPAMPSGLPWQSRM